MREFWTRWPLLVIGGVLVAYAATSLVDLGDPSDARALLLGIGSMLLGAGLVLIVQGVDRPRHRDRGHDHDHDPGHD